MSSLTVHDFDYDLPTELIAQTPVEPRDHSRLLYLNRTTGQVEHHHFYDLPLLLQPSDIIVRNNTKVMPARLVGHKPTGGQIEILLLQREKISHQGESWRCLTKPGLKLGATLIFNDSLQATCTQIEGYERVIQFNLEGYNFLTELDRIGQTPLPPYITWHVEDEPMLRERYQTTYAKINGSVAAPTAGLHFTPKLDQKLKLKGVEVTELTLHVGLGTFQPVKTLKIADHHLHSEWFELTTETAEKINTARQAGRRVIAVGTTSVRVLESCADDTGQLTARTDSTQIYIYPPYRFKVVQGLITNFHQPKSTLTMLVSAFTSEPNTAHAFSTFQQSLVGQAYQTAIDHHYRFHSFGDAMLIL